MCGALQQLAGHVREGGFITKFRKIFLRDENERRPGDGAGPIR